MDYRLMNDNDVPIYIVVCNGRMERAFTDPDKAEAFMTKRHAQTGKASSVLPLDLEITRDAAPR